MTGLLVFLGGGTGALARWLLAVWLPHPWGTFAANVGGSFVLALLLASPWGRDDSWKALVGTGMMGGFTTYSTFNVEVLNALQREAWGLAAGYAIGTAATCLIAGALGWWVGTLLSR